MNTQTGQDRSNLRAALLDLGKADYEAIRTDLIGRLGYDQFREMQNGIFKEIGTIAFDKLKESKTKVMQEFGADYKYGKPTYKRYDNNAEQWLEWKRQG